MRLLWVVVIGLCLALLAVVRQLGVLHERIAPVGALMLAKGLKVGESAPRSRRCRIWRAAAHSRCGARRQRATLLMFVSPTCPVCKALLPVLKSSLTSEREWLDIVLASDGEIAATAGVRAGASPGRISLRGFRAARHCLPGQPAAVCGADRRAGRAARARDRQFARTSGEPVRGQAAWRSHRSRIISKRRRNIRPLERTRPMKWLDVFAENSARALARRTSRRNVLAGLGSFLLGAAAVPLLPVARGAETKRGRAMRPMRIPAIRCPATTGGTAPSTGSSAAVAAARNRCARRARTCPRSLGSAPATTPATAIEYVISYNDCCGKSSCGRCFCNRNEGDSPLFQPGKSNDYNWCSGNSKANIPYHCSTARIVGVAR